MSNSLYKKAKPTCTWATVWSDKERSSVLCPTLKNQVKDLVSMANIDYRKIKE